MGKKCYFCEHDRGPFMEKPEVCNECQDYDKFQFKTIIDPRILNEYELFRKAELKKHKVEELKNAFYREANSISAMLPTMRNHLNTFPKAKELRFIFDPIEQIIQCIDNLERQTRILMMLYEELEDGEKYRRQD